MATAETDARSPQPWIRPDASPEASVEAYVEHFVRLVDLEREEEMRRHEREIRSLSGPEREERGRAILSLRGRDEGEALEGRLLKFMRRPGEELPETEIAVGDLVMLSRDDPLRDDNPTGTVVERTGYSVTVAVDGRPPAFLTGKGIRIDLYVNDITYQRMEDALRSLPGASGPLARLRDVLVGLREPAAPRATDPGEWLDADLDDSQRGAVRRALGAPDLFLVHGPPGTGKTTTLVEVVRQHVARGRSVLATADSNVAVDNVVELLAGAGAAVVRVGHPARVTPALRAHTLDALLRENATWRESRALRDRAFEVKDEQDALTHPSGRWRRGMSNEKIRELASRNRGSRGVSAGTIREMAEWLDLEEEADELFARSRRLEDEAIGEVLAGADVVCATNSTAGSEILAGRSFDVVAIDEATQASEPSCLIPLTRGERVVLVGDHRQLPPTILNEDAAREGLARTLFERLARAHGDADGDADGDAGGDGLVGMLTVQYRMHRAIMDFPSRRFYDGRLRAHESVRHHTLRGLGFDESAAEGRLRPVLVPEDPVVFLDTRNVEAPERSRADSPSRENPVEAEWAVRLAAGCLRSGLRPGDVAVISPYADQVDRIRRELDREVEGAGDVEVRTVDGFQGREKEAVIISLVRSNPGRRVGFLSDVRRFNVAVTRARRKLIVVGDSTTVAGEPVYRDFVEYVRDAGRVIEA